jgi:HEAT repeat protein
MSAKAKMIFISALLMVIGFLYIAHREVNYYIFSRAIEHKITTNDVYDQQIADRCMSLIEINPQRYDTLLLRDLGSSNQDRSDYAAYIIRYCKIDVSKASFKLVKDSKYLHVRRNAISLVEPDKTNCDYITRLFLDPSEDQQIRYICGNLMARSNNADMINANVKLLKAKDPSVVKKAISVLGSDLDIKYLSEISKMIDNPDDEIKCEAVIAIRKMGGEIEPKYLQLIYRRHRSLTKRALTEMGSKGDKKAIPYLENFIKIVKEPDLKKEAKRVLEGLRK